MTIIKPSHGFTMTQKRQLLRNYTVLTGVLDAEKKSMAVIPIETIKACSALPCPSESVYTFNQHIYKMRMDKLLKSKKIDGSANSYNTTPAGKKYLEEHTAIAQEFLSEGITFDDLFSTPQAKNALPKARMPEVPVSQSASRAIDSIGLIIDENRALHGFLKRLHIEIGQVLGQMNNNENDN